MKYKNYCCRHRNDNLHPREKANLLREAIRIADENEDVQWAVEMRLDLIYELNLLSADAEEITVFSKILDDYENHKDVIKEDDILWKYKWIWACTFDLPSIPMEQVEAVGEDYKTRILRNGLLVAELLSPLVCGMCLDAAV